MAPGEPSSEYGSGPFKPRPGSDAETGGVVPPAPAAQPPLERPGDQIGPFKLLSLLGEGGFGAVWLAERREPFVQRVALKLIKPGMDSKAVLARFEQERQALAVMNHPGIAKVLDGGLTPSGRPYFAMEYVRGEPITDFCDSRKLGIKERLALFEQVCEAIQHAHLKGIVHRDIKPGNILAFQTDDGRPTMKVIDFGVAKAMSHTMAAQTIFTDSGVMVGTLEYMSPEQTDAASQDIDTRSDIYSLGVLLYEILTGAPPFDPQDLRKRAYGEIQRIIREVDPPSPSGRLSTIVSKDPQLGERIGTARHASIDEMVRQLRTELEWIPLKAMRKERQHRYQTALELANDIRAYIDGRPIAAAPESATYRLRKYVRRNRTLVAGVGAVIIVLLAGLAVSTWQWRQAIIATDTARREKVIADQATQQMQLERAEADRLRIAAEEDKFRIQQQQEQYRSLDIATSRAELFRAGLRGEPEYVADLTVKLARLDAQTGFTEGLIEHWSKPNAEQYQAHSDWIRCIAVSPDGGRVASGADDGTLTIWDTARRELIWKELPVHRDWIRALAFSLDGNFIVTGSDDGTMQVLEVDRGTLLSQPIAAHDAGVTALAFAPGQQLLASGGADGDVKIWSAGAWDVLHHLESTNEADITSLTFFDSGEGGMLLIRGDEAGSLEVFSVGEIHKAESNPVSSVSLGSAIRSISFGASPQMRMIAICESGEVYVFNNPSRLGEPQVDQRLLVAPSAIAIDGSTSIAAILAARGSTDELLVVPVERERFVEARTTTVSELTHAPFCVALSPNGDWAVTGGQTGDVEVLDLFSLRRLPTPSESEIDVGERMSTRPQSTRLFTSDTSSRVQEWDAITRRAVGAPLRTFEDSSSAPTDFSRKSIGDIQTDAQQSVLAARRGSALEIWDIDRRRRLRSFDLPRGGVFALSESGTQVALLDRSGISVVDIDDAELGPSVRVNGTDPLLLQFIDGDRSLLAVTSDELVVIELGSMIQRTYGTNSFPSGRSSAASGPGFIALAISDSSPTVFCDGECSQLEASRSAIQVIAAHSNGRDIVGGGSDFIRVWDKPSGKIIGDVQWPDGEAIRCIGFTNGCQSLAIISESLYGSATLQFLESTTSATAAGSDGLATYREAMSQVRDARGLLAERIAQVGDSVDSVEAFDLKVRTDPRFAGRLWTAALIVVAEVSADRELARRSAERKRDK